MIKSAEKTRVHFGREAAYDSIGARLFRLL